MAQARRAPQSRFLPFDNLRPRLQQSTAVAALGWASADDIGANLCDRAILLGIDNEVAHFALDLVAGANAEAVTQAQPDRNRLTSSPEHQFIDARSAAMTLTQPETGILAQARSQLDWHRKHGFCNQCGMPTQMNRGGQARQCTGCNASLFPRTDPVAIMLVIDEAGDRCLLGQPHGPLVSTGMYSALAGFIDQGESIEAAVRREVSEEASIVVGAVRYHSSQPWPFPYSLMIGCMATALSTNIQIDEDEMADVRWFERDLVAAALERAHTGQRPQREVLSVPGSMAIAHHLIKAWIDND